MRIGIISRFGDGLDLAIDAKRDGHECRAWIQESQRRHIIFEGLVNKVERYQELKGWADFLFFDANHLEKEWEAVQSWKVPCWNGSTATNKLESDRDFARGLFEQYGMKSLKSDSFNTIEEAIKFISKSDGLLVGKVFGGDAESEDVVISELKGGLDLIAILQRYADSGKKYDGVEIQERVIGVEVGCAAYYSHGKQTGPIEISYQHKEPSNGFKGATRGLGALCGESGTLSIYVTPDNLFYKKTLGLFSDYFKKIDFTGECDIGTMTNEKGISALEFTPGRPGYPDCFLRRSLSKTPQMDFFYSCAIGKPIAFETHPGLGICYLLMAPGFPYQEAVEKHSAGYPVMGYDESNPNMHLQEVTKGKRGIEVAKGCGYAAVISGRGNTIEEAQRNAMWLYDERNPKRLYIPKSNIRTDIGDRVLIQKQRIIKYGILTEKDFSGMETSPSKDVEHPPRPTKED